MCNLLSSPSLSDKSGELFDPKKMNIEFYRTNYFTYYKHQHFTLSHYISVGKLDLPIFCTYN